MTHKLIIYLFCLTFLISCNKPKVDPVNVEQKVTGEWTNANGGAGGFNNSDTFKNFQYVFEVPSNNQEVSINLSAPIDIQYILFNSLGQQIAYSYANKSAEGQHTLNAGKYRIVICANRRDVGTFSLVMKGITAAPSLIESQIVRTNSQSWGALGGGGLGYYSSFKNHYYQFEVTEDNTSVDVEMESADTEIFLQLFDQLGSLITQQYGDRYHYIIKNVKKGIYSLAAGTITRGSVGNYKVSIFGKVKNLTRVSSNTSSVTGRWPDNTSYDTYSLQVDEANTTLDIELLSAETYVMFYVQTNVGSTIYTMSPYNQKTAYQITNSIPKGVYKIVVAPYRYFGQGGFGNYTLNVVGQYSNFKKL